MQNRALFLKHYSVTTDRLAEAGQVGGDGIKIVNEPGYHGVCDALITDQHEIYLRVLTADCAPVLIWSDQKPVIAAVHSGWQGSALNILGKTIQKMVNKFKLAAASLNVVIGPALSADNFEVGSEFSEKFPADYLIPQAGGRFKLDNNRFLKDSAIQAGVDRARVEIMNYCSYRDENMFFSHRRDFGVTGRMMSIIGIGS